MSENNKIQLTDDWFVGTDGMSFILLKRRVVQSGPKAKKENVGTERYDPVGYYSTLGSLVDGLHRYMSMDALTKSGVSTLEDYIVELGKMIDEFRMIDRMMVGRLRKQMGVSDE